MMRIKILVSAILFSMILVMSILVYLKNNNQENLFITVKSINTSLVNSNSSNVSIYISDMPDVSKDLSLLNLSFSEKKKIFDSMKSGIIFSIHGDKHFGFEYIIESNTEWFGFGARRIDGFFYSENDITQSEYFDIHSLDDFEYSKIEEHWYRVTYFD